MIKMNHLANLTQEPSVWIMDWIGHCKNKVLYYVPNCDLTQNSHKPHYKEPFFKRIIYLQFLFIRSSQLIF